MMSSSEAATLTPTIIHPTTNISLPDVLLKCGSSVASGGLCSRGNIAWLVLGNSVVVIDTVSGKTIQSWIPPHEAGKIIHVTELDFDTNCQTLLAVGLERNGHGVVVVLSPNTTKMLRAIEVPEPITSVHPFSSSAYASFVNGYYLPDLFEDSVLAHFSGVVAVGCLGGKVYLINLHMNLDDHQSFGFSLDFSKICLIDENFKSEEVHAVGESGQHACILLTRDCFSQGSFIYQKRSFSPHAVKVTALQVISQIRCLCIGYSFGGFHIYSLSPQMFICSSPLPQYAPSVAVTHFTYLEPENDPRSFVYLWVARGSSPIVQESVGSETKISLYQMIFTDKVPCRNQQGTMYENLQSCCLRLEYALTPTPSTPNPSASVGSHVLRCFTVQHFRHGRGLDESNDGPSHLLDQTVSVFVWNSGEEFVLGLFDINQWYQAQMPNTVYWKRSGKYSGVLGCSYFGVYSLKSLTELGSMQVQLLDVGLTNFLHFNSHSPVPETHTWPTSLGFHLTALSESSIHSCECFGLQNLALHELDLCRGALYAQPERFFNLCMQSEMLLQHWEYTTGVIDLNLQRKALLTVMMEWDCPTQVVSAFAESWLSDGSCAPIVTEWLSLKLNEVDSEKDSLCTYHGKALFEGSTTSLSSYWRQLTAVIILIEKILSYVSVSDVSENSVFLSIDELYYKAVTQQRVFEVIEFLASHGLACESGDDGTGQFVAIAKHCEQLRGHGQNRQKLAVDYLSEEVDQSYPPQSLVEFLAVFETSVVLAQHCLVLYLLCDLQKSLNYDGLPEMLTSYCYMESLPARTDVFVYNLWLLDNKAYHMLGKTMLQFPKEVAPVFKWHHSVVIDNLLRDRKYRLALHYIENFGVQMQLIDEVKAKLTVFIYNQKLNAAHGLMVQYEESEIFEDLFNHFLDINYKVKSLHLLVDLPFSEVEEDIFISYLSKHQNLVVREILIFYFLSQRRYVEAMAVHEEIKWLSKNDVDPSTAQRCLQRETILKGFIIAVPNVLEKRTSLHKGVSDTSRVIAEGSLSSVVARATANEAQVGSHAGLIYNTLQSIAEKRSTKELPLTPFKRPENGAKERTAVPFLSTPVSVKKARVQSHKNLTFTPSHKLAPSPLTAQTLTMLDNTSFTSFQAHMLCFRDRVASMLDQSPVTSALDNSDICTPATAPSSLLTKPGLSIVTPPSILKKSLSTKHTGTEGKKISFAADTPTLTPLQKRSNQRRMPSGFTPATVSSLTTNVVSLATSTPLPPSDDSDQFESPVESPSQLEGHFFQVESTPPRFQLYGDQDVSMTLDKPSIADSNVPLDQVMDGNIGGEKGDSHRAVDQSFDDQDHGQEFHKSVVTASKPSPPLKGLMEKLTRESITSMEPLKVTPLKSKSGDKAIENPMHPVQTSTTPSSLAEPTRLFSPIPLLSQLVETKREKLKKSLDEVKGRHSSVTLEQKEKQAYFSPTMVKYPTDSGVSASSTLLGKQYSFSPPTELHVEQKSSRPSISEFDSTSFVFSPPLTRSAARRMKKDTDMSMSVSEHTETKKKGKGRPAKQTTPSNPLKATEVVMISPSSHPATPTASAREVGRVKRGKPVKSGVQTRRSARLLSGRK